MGAVLERSGHANRLCIATLYIACRLRNQPAVLVRMERYVGWNSVASRSEDPFSSWNAFETRYRLPGHVHMVGGQEHLQRMQPNRNHLEVRYYRCERLCGTGDLEHSSKLFEWILRHDRLRTRCQVHQIPDARRKDTFNFGNHRSDRSQTHTAAKPVVLHPLATVPAGPQAGG